MPTTFDEVLALRPDLAAPYRDFLGVFWDRRLVEPVVLDLCRLRVAQLLGCASELAVRTRAAVDAGLASVQVERLPGWPSEECFTDEHRAALAIAEQFVLDPHGVDSAMRDAMVVHVGTPGLVALVEALALFDGFTRFRLLLCDEPAVQAVVDPPLVSWASSALPDGADPAISQSALGEQPEALVAFLRLYGTMWSHGQLEHSIKEVARLRNARVTGCGYCRNVRFSVARDEGLTEERVALIDDGFEGSALSEREKVVIAYTDTFLRSPGELSDAQRAELGTHFSPGELVELTMGIALFMGFSKIAVTLGQAPADMPTMVVPTPDWSTAP